MTVVVGPTTTVERIRRPFRADVHNVRSTPTAKALLAGSVVMAVASCVANLSTVADSELSSVATIELAMHSSTVTTLIFSLIAGVVSSTADFRFGRIDQLLLSEPNRAVLLAAKVMVGAVVGVVYGVIGSMVAVATTASYFVANGASLDVGSNAVIHPLIGLLLGTAMFGAVGVSVGTVVQSQPAAIAGSLAWLFIVEPTALLGLPDVGRWLPGVSGLALTASPNPDLLDQIPGGILLVCWFVFSLAVALMRFRRSDF